MRSILPAALALALAGCGHAHTVHDGTSATTDEGLLQLSLTTDPSPVSKGANTFVVLLNRVGGGPLTGATVLAETFRAGSEEPLSEKPVVTELGDGRYELADLQFPDSGEYHVTFHITHHDTELHDHATFRFVIP